MAGGMDGLGDQKTGSEETPGMGVLGNFGVTDNQVSDQQLLTA